MAHGWAHEGKDNKMKMETLESVLRLFCIFMLFFDPLNP